MIKKTSTLVTALILSCSLIFAQKGLDNDANTSKNLLKDWSVGVNYGTTNFNGDITQYDYAPATQTGLSYQDEDFKESRSAFSLSLEKKIDEKLSISLEYVSGEFAGLRRPNEYVGFETDDPYGIIAETAEGMNGQKFVTSFNETDILLNYDVNSNIAKLIKTELPKNISVILKMGFGYNLFRSLRTNLYTDEYVYSFGYDELTKNESDMISETTIIYGAKIKYEIKDGLSLLADYTVRNSMSDKWDSSIMDGGNGGDRFSLFSFGLAYEIQRNDNLKD
jgi:hypothetical protein